MPRLRPLSLPLFLCPPDLMLYEMRPTDKFVPSLPLPFLILWITLASGVGLTIAADETPHPPPGAPKKNADGALGGVITLYARDALACDFSLNDGGYGAVV